MNILVLAKSEQEKDLFKLIEKKVIEKYPGFFWRVSQDKGELSTLGQFNIVSGSIEVPEAMRDATAILFWPMASVFLKDKEHKQKVWDDIEHKVVPAFKTKVSSKTSLEVQDLPSMFELLKQASLPFSFTDRDGCSVLVNPSGKESLTEFDVVLTSSDLAAMLAAQLVFDAKRINMVLK